MVLLSIFFTRIRSTEGSSVEDCSLFILSLHALALHLAVKILLQIFRMKIWARWPYTHLSVAFPSRMPAGPQFLCCTTNTIKWKHSNICYKSSTKHKEVDQIETIKMIMQTTRLVSWKVLPMAQVAIFKEIFDQVWKRFRPWIVLFWGKTSQRLTLYLLSSHR